jgi:multidrug resistance efflux pump
LRPRLSCDRVAIGLVDNAHIKLAALSEAATFEKNTPLVKAYVSTMEEAFDAGQLVCQQKTATSQPAAEIAQSHPMHLALLAVSGATHVISLPLKQGAECVGILVVERSEDRAFEPADFEWLEAFGALLACVVVQRRLAERTSLGRLGNEIADFFENLFGPGHLVLKVGSCAALLLAGVLALVHIDYRVPAKTVIEGEVQRVVAAPFEGFIGESYVRAGDTVNKGQPLAQLDDRDLKTEEARWSSERDQYQNKQLEAMANHDLTAVQVIGAQLSQAQAQLTLVLDKIERARLIAPYDGLVVSGDLSQQIGSPVEAGKKLFEISPLTSYRVILQVDEREIRHVHAGQKGHIVMTGIAGDPMAMTVLTVTPVAIAQEGRNYFRVEARLGEATARLRPGMEGIGKIETGSHSLWWILTHSLTDWLRLTLWGWLP